MVDSGAFQTRSIQRDLLKTHIPGLHAEKAQGSLDVSGPGDSEGLDDGLAFRIHWQLRAKPS